MVVAGKVVASVFEQTVVGAAVVALVDSLQSATAAGLMPSVELTVVAVAALVALGLT